MLHCMRPSISWWIKLLTTFGLTKTHNLNITKDAFMNFLSVYFNGNLYEHIRRRRRDEFTIRSTHGKCVYVLSGRETQTREYTSEFLQKISGRDASFSTWPFRLQWIAYYSKWSPSSIQFTTEAAANNRLPFIGMEITKVDHRPETCVYRRKTNKRPALRESCRQQIQRPVTSRNYARLCKTLSSTLEFFRKNI